jgi:hypothetical protein
MLLEQIDWLHAGALLLGFLLLLNSIFTLISFKYYSFVYERAFGGKLSPKEIEQKERMRGWQRYGVTLRELFIAGVLISWGLGWW